MSKKQPKPRWSVEQRLEFIDYQLFWDRRINRGDLADFFGISIPQASADLREYQQAAPSNVKYDTTAKTYVATESFAPAFVTPSADQYLAQLRLIAAGILSEGQSWIAHLPVFDVVPIVRRRLEPQTVQRVLQVIRSNAAIYLRYQSFSHLEPTWRWIAPHAFVFDGFRWHVRAWCHIRLDFRDFVLARVLEMGPTRPAAIDPSRDAGWHREVTLRIGPHPKMHAAARRVIEVDYGMVDGIVEVRTRVCLSQYLERHLGLDLDASQVAPERQQIVLINREEVEAARREVQIMSLDTRGGHGAHGARS